MRLATWTQGHRKIAQGRDCVGSVDSLLYTVRLQRGTPTWLPALYRSMIPSICTFSPPNSPFVLPFCPHHLQALDVMFCDLFQQTGLTLTNFTRNLVPCQAVLHWKILLTYSHTCLIPAEKVKPLLQTEVGCLESRPHHPTHQPPPPPS